MAGMESPDDPYRWPRIVGALVVVAVVGFLVLTALHIDVAALSMLLIFAAKLLDVDLPGLGRK